MSTTTKKPRGKYVPTTDGLVREFFEHAADGTLHLQTCSSCSAVHHPPVWRCTNCSSEQLGWAPSPGRGTLFSWTTSHRPFDTGWADEVPWVTAVVELDEGPRIVGHLAGVDPGELKIGQSVRVEPVAVDDGFTFLRFSPQV